MASQILCRAKKRERAIEGNQHRERWSGVSSAMNEKQKQKNNGVAFSVLGPDAFLHRQLGVGSSG